MVWWAKKVFSVDYFRDFSPPAVHTPYKCNKKTPERKSLKGHRSDTHYAFSGCHFRLFSNFFVTWKTSIIHIQPFLPHTVSYWCCFKSRCVHAVRQHHDEWDWFCLISISFLFESHIIIEVRFTSSRTSRRPTREGVKVGEERSVESKSALELGACRTATWTWDTAGVDTVRYFVFVWKREGIKRGGKRCEWQDWDEERGEEETGDRWVEEGVRMIEGGRGVNAKKGEEKGWGEGEE